MAHDSIDDVKISTYESTVRHWAQQEQNRLRRFCMERGEESKDHNWERMLPATAETKTGRKTATPDSETQWQRRQSIPITKHVSDYASKEDTAMMLVDPNSNFAKAHSFAMNREQDSEIIRAATSDSRSGTGTAITFPTAQNVGGATTRFSFDLVTQVTEKFLENDVPMTENKVMVISPAVARRLLQLTEFTNNDYNVKNALNKGYIDDHMGYAWVVSTLLTAPSAGQRYCFAMTPEAIGMNINKDIWVRVTEDNTKSYAWNIYAASTFGAVRVDDERLVRIHVLE